METGFIDATVYDTDREDTLHYMVIACAYVQESAMTDPWLDPSFLYPSLADWKRGAKGVWEEGPIKDIFADEIVNQGARVLTGFWGLGPCESLSEILTRSNAQIGANIFCPFFTDPDTYDGMPSAFPLCSFIYGPYGKVKCQEEEHIPEWSSFAALDNLKVEDVWVDDERIIVDQDEKDFSPRGDAIEAQDHIQRIWECSHFESFIPLVRDHLLDPQLRTPCKDVMRWLCVPWENRDAIENWDQWTPEHWSCLLYTSPSPRD